MEHLKEYYWEKALPDEFHKQAVEGFIHAFSAPPRHEKWTDAQASDFIQGHFDRGGWCTALTLGSTLVGLQLSMPLREWSEKAQFEPEVDTDKAVYLSTLFVDPVQMNRGIGARLLSEEIKRVRERGSKFICARTRTDTPSINHLLEKNGFSILRTVNNVTGGDLALRYLHYKVL